MKKFVKFMAAVCSLAIMLSASAFVHSGRLDSNGGHHKRSDNTYHYHLGSDRTVEYSSKPGTSTKSSSASSSSSSSSYTAARKTTPVQEDYLVLSKMHTFIDGYEIPTFSHSKNGGAYIIAEDLKDYGFDTAWDGTTNTLTVIKNTEKAITPLPMSYYNSFGSGYKFFKISKTNGVSVLFKNNAGDKGYSPNSLSCGGYMAISIDELNRKRII